MTLDGLGIERAHFAGWSAGGKALIEFLAYPRRIRTLTLVEPGAYWILEQLGVADPDMERTNAFMHALFGKEVTEDELAAFLEVAGLASSKEEARSDPYWERAVPHRMALSWYSEDFDRIGRLIEELAIIRCPVLLVKGSVTTDRGKRVVEVLGQRLPNATVLELPGDRQPHPEHRCVPRDVREAPDSDIGRSGCSKSLDSPSMSRSPCAVSFEDHQDVAGLRRRQSAGAV